MNMEHDRATQPLIFDTSVPGARAVTLPELDVPQAELPAAWAASEALDLPQIGPLDLVRHYTRLSRRNFCVDANIYPLGSCTMKYNPAVNEVAARLPGLAGLHPLQDEADLQGALRLLYELEQRLAQLAGLEAVSLQPSAGAQGEYTALKVIRAYFNDPQGGHAPGRVKVLAPDTAHGTNPASCAMCGAEALRVPSRDGLVDLDALRAMVDDQTAALMITNPNTVGLFDGQIAAIADILHQAGALLYLDGANMNAIVGISRPGDFGVDAMHFNTHKTFSTPHGCGGPGAGPIAVRAMLAPYLPVPRVVRREGAKGQEPVYGLDDHQPRSIGRVRSFLGQFGVLVRCWAYLAACGPEGLRHVAQTAVLSANYVAAKLRDRFETPYFDPDHGRWSAHEFICVPRKLLARGVTLVDIAKRMIDYGIHPPTMHWPVHDCLMIEPTETESLASLDRLVEVLHTIANEVESNPELVRQAPLEAVVGRVDEVAAARHPVVKAS